MKNKNKKIIGILILSVVLIAASIIIPIVVKGDNNDAGTSQVLSGKTFTNGSAVALTGTMKDFSEQIPKLTATAEAADEDYVVVLEMDPGYYENIKVDAKAIYNKGYNDGYAARNTSTASISYTYHHHCVSGNNIHVNDSSSTSGNTYADNYSSSTSGGCFTQAVPHYHSHVSSCYSTCGGATSKDYIPASGGYINGVWYSGDGSGEGDYVRVCSKCGNVSGRGDGSGEKVCTQKVLTCGKTTSTVESYTYTRSCGLTANEIVQAVINYN